jgi:DNA-binding beta-propeller fold protein YncE
LTSELRKVYESSMQCRLGLLVFLVVVHITAHAAVTATPLVLEAKIPLGAVAGRIDHLAFDLARQRLYVAELGNQSVGVVDLSARRLIRTVTGFHEPQGIAYEPNTDTVYVANGGDGSVRLFSGSDFAALGRIALGKDADNVRVDRVAKRVYVGYGDGALAVIDPATRKRIADIALKAHPESFQLDPNGNSIFVNVPDAAEIAVVSRDSGRQHTSWSTGDLRANFPLAIDRENGRIISIFRQPARLETYEIPTGRRLGGADVCKDSDDVFVDSKRNRVYVICGEGFVDVLNASQNAYSRVARLATSSGSRTGLFLPELDELVVAVRASSTDGAQLWIFRCE